MRKIGIYGGSFDPVHMGHLNLAEQVLDKLNLDEIRFVPCHIPPHKRELCATADQRLTMLQLALKEKPRFNVDIQELQRDSVSYSLETLLQIRKTIGFGPCLIFIIGWDSWLSLPQWYNWKDLFKLCNFAVAKRPGTHSHYQEIDPFIASRWKPETEITHHSHGYCSIVNTVEYDVSSSFIREQLAGISFGTMGDRQMGIATNSPLVKNPSAYLNHEVWDYIKHNNVYFFQKRE